MMNWADMFFTVQMPEWEGQTPINVSSPLSADSLAKLSVDEAAELARAIASESLESLAKV